jgi:hypothetical protein
MNKVYHLLCSLTLNWIVSNENNFMENIFKGALLAEYQKGLFQASCLSLLYLLKLFKIVPDNLVIKGADPN